jgi:glycosyltransferase involved in cell wall biosynthesis
MKVLIVYPQMYIYGGAELLIVRLANYLSRNGIQNALLTTHLLPEIANDFSDTQIIQYPRHSRDADATHRNPLKLVWLLNKGVRQHLRNFDLINVHNYPAEFCTWPLHKPVVWMCNEPLDVAVQVRLAQASKLSIKRLFFKALLAVDRHVVRKYVKNVVVADQFNKRRFINLYGFNPHVIHYGIDYDFFSAQPHTVSAKLNSSFCVLHVGMLTPLKNQMQSIKTIEKLKDAIPDIKLILAGLGEGEYLETVKAYLNDHQLHRHVEITGHVSREQIRNLFHTSNALLHPIGSQGGWLSPFEALCAGLPIVVSPETTASDLVQNENLGVVTDDYTRALLEIYQKPDKYDKMKGRRAAWVRENLSWDKFSENMIRVFQKTLEEKNHCTR